MRDGRTVERNAGPRGQTDDLAAWEASLVVVAGGPEGNEHLIDRARLVLGRGPGVDLAFEDDRMSQQHAALEFAAGRFHVTDLESTNGTQVNGAPVDHCELSHGDRIGVGGMVFQILIEKREAPPRAYLVEDA